MVSNDLKFVNELKQNGWTETENLWEYAKGDWKIVFDTSSWMIVETKNNPRVFDVFVPGEYESGWTVNLIEHLCRIEDERYRLRVTLERIRDSKSSDHTTRSMAKDALLECYHNWLVDMEVPEDGTGRLYCPICNQTEKR